MKAYLYYWLLGLFLLSSNASFAQISSGFSPDSTFSSALNLSFSAGSMVQRNASFYGFGADWNQQIGGGKFGIGTNLMWDQETSKEQNEGTVRTFTFALTGNYMVFNNLAIGTGIGKGFVDDDNPNQQYKFTNGDWATGLFIGYQGLLGSNKTIGLTGSYEYNITKKETSLSLDLSLGLIF